MSDKTTEQRLQELQQEATELKKAEEWKTLVDRIKYRKIGTDVRLNIIVSVDTRFTLAETKKIATLPERIQTCTVRHLFNQLWHLMRIII